MCICGGGCDRGRGTRERIGKEGQGKGKRDERKDRERGTRERIAEEGRGKGLGKRDEGKDWERGTKQPVSCFSVFHKAQNVSLNFTVQIHEVFTIRNTIRCQCIYHKITLISSAVVTYQCQFRGGQLVIAGGGY